MRISLMLDFLHPSLILYDISVPLLQHPRSRDVNTLHLRGLLQLLQILLRQMRVRILHSRKLTVLVLEVELQNDTANTRNRNQSNVDPHCLAVLVVGTSRVCERGPDTRSVADTVDERERSGTFCWRARNGVGDPGVDSTVHEEDAVEQEEAEVARAKRFGEHEDEGAGDGEWNRVGEEPEAVARFVGEDAVREGGEDDEDVGRRDEQEGDDVVVAE